MRIENLTDLITAVGEWLDRDDLVARSETFVQIVEARLNRLLRDPQMEVRSETVATGEFTALPTDFGEIVSISTGDGRLVGMGPVEFSSLDSQSGTPRYYAIIDNSIAFYPANATTPITLVYRRRIPALTNLNPTNWLLELAPDAYLYGVLMQAEGWDSNDDRVSGWRDLYNEAIAELRLDAERRRYGPGPLAPRIRRA